MNYLKLLVIYAIGLFILHIIPTSLAVFGSEGSALALNRVEIFSLRSDHLVHALVFLPWMILVWLYLNKEKVTGIKRFKMALVGLLAGLLLAGIAEGVQYWIPYRTFNPVDVIANMTGVLLGSVVFSWSYKPNRTKR